MATTSNSRIAAVALRWVAVLALAGASACGAASNGTLVHTAAPVSSAVVATIPLGDYGIDAAVRADGARVYVAARTGKVIAIDTVSRQVAGTITTDGQPAAIALTPDGRRAYVMDLTAQNVFVLDTVNDLLLKRIPVGIIARAVMTPSVAVARNGGRVYVTNATVEDDHLLVIDTATNTIVGDHFLGVHPAGVAVSADGKLVYVAGCKLACIDGTLLALDAATAAIVFQVPLAAAPTGLGLAPDGSRAYVPNTRAATVGVVDLQAKTATTISTGAQPAGIAVDPLGAYVYVASYGDSRIDVIDTRSGTMVANVGLADQPRAIAVSPDGRTGYVTYSARVVSVVDLSRVTGRVPQ